MITSQQANAILTTVARYRISEHLMARELYAPGRVTHGAAHRCERALNVHTRVNSLIEWTSETRPTQADLDPAMTAIDAALVQMNIHTSILLSKLREVGVDPDTIPNTYHVLNPGPPPTTDDLTFIDAASRPLGSHPSF